MKKHIAIALAGAIIGAVITAAVFVLIGRSEVTIKNAWVKLYEDPEFGGQALTVLHSSAKPDSVATLGDIGNFDDTPPDNKTDRDFNDKASSVTFLLPKGWTAILFEDADYKNAQFKLVGTGKVESISDFGK